MDMNNKPKKRIEDLTERDVLGWVIGIVGFGIGIGLGVWILIEIVMIGIQR
jgi:hypothetical protein